MDPPTSSRIPGLPRPSRLPGRPSSRATGSVDEGSGIVPPSGLPGLPKRSSIALPQRPASSMRSYGDAPSMRPRTGTHTQPNNQQESGTNKVASPSSPGSPLSTLSTDSTIVAEESILPKSTTNPRKSRPSLSDRTMETLAQVPPSPSPAKRRQSGFFAAESPAPSGMQPPSRTGSSLGYNRPGSRAGTSFPGIRPSSPTKVPTASTSRLGGPLTPANRRSISSASGKTGAAANNRLSMQLGGSSKMPSLGATPGSKLGSTVRPPNGSKTFAARPTAPKSPVKDVFGGPLPKTTSQLKGSSKPTLKALKPVQGRGLIGTPGQPRGLKKPQATSQTSQATDLPREEIKSPTSPSPAEERKTSSSANLRATIAAARAARRSSAFSSQQEESTPRAATNDNFSSLGPDTDPNGLDLMDSTHMNIVKKRINNARKDGKLNIAALCLSEIPVEVLKMYEYDPNDKSSSSWYESVDVTRLVAADNEFKELPSEIFPSVSPQESTEPSDAIFTGLVDIDIHGNALQSLPSTMGNLPVITALNLSRNQLGNECLDVLSNIKSLKELRLSENKFEGMLPESIGQLEGLVTLDLHRNQIKELPASIGRLSKLSKLTVSENRLSSIPFEAIFDLKITEVVASRNQLNGYLIPSNVTFFPSLKILDVSTNALLGLSEGSLEMPSLQKLEIANNRISALPSVAGWAELVTLNAEENKLSAFPEGFTKLMSLVHVDVGNNSLLEIDDEVGFMDALKTFNIKNNPLRERRLPRLGVEELKAELRNRKAEIAAPTSPSASKDVTSPTASWPVKAGVLDRSNMRMQSLDKSDLEPLVNEKVTSLVLHHNQLSKISPAIELLGSTLTTLDLANNKLGKSDMYLTESLSLPNLQSLNLTSNALVSLDPLVNRLSAPKLTALIIPFNRIKTLPKICEAFPSLTRFIAANNAISVLDVDAVRGLQVLDVSSNEIDHLPPRLAILQGQLRTLVVTGNKFRVPGYAMLQKGTEDLLNWLRTRIPAGEEGAIGNEQT